MKKKYISGIVFLFSMIVFLNSCDNIFSPRLDNTTATSILTEQKTIEGVFQNFKYAYTFKDTTVYGNLLGQDFVFTYRDYTSGFDESWDRATDMRTTNGLFRNSQKLEVVWNNIIFQGGDSLEQNVKRSFNFTITFNPGDVVRINGFADMNFRRNTAEDIWKIVRWRDESF